MRPMCARSSRRPAPICFPCRTTFATRDAGGPPDQVAQLNGDLQAAQVQVKNLEGNEQALESLVAKQAATQDELAQTQASLAKARGNLQALQAKKQDLAAARIGHRARRRLARQPGAGTGAIA